MIESAVIITAGGSRPAPRSRAVASAVEPLVTIAIGIRPGEQLGGAGVGDDRVPRRRPRRGRPSPARRRVRPRAPAARSSPGSAGPSRSGASRPRRAHAAAPTRPRPARSRRPSRPASRRGRRGSRRGPRCRRLRSRADPMDGRASPTGLGRPGSPWPDDAARLALLRMPPRRRADELARLGPRLPRLLLGRLAGRPAGAALAGGTLGTGVPAPDRSLPSRPVAPRRSGRTRPRLRDRAGPTTVDTGVAPTRSPITSPNGTGCSPATASLPRSSRSTQLWSAFSGPCPFSVASLDAFVGERAHAPVPDSSGTLPPGRR